MLQFRWLKDVDHILCKCCHKGLATSNKVFRFFMNVPSGLSPLQLFMFSDVLNLELLGAVQETNIIFDNKCSAKVLQAAGQTRTHTK